MPITEWHADALIAKASGWAVNGMEDACQFAETEAKARAPVRTGLMQSEIKHTVRAYGTDITGYVGVFKGSKAFYVTFVEFGTSKMPARPFLRRAVFGNKAKIVKLLAGGR